MHDDEITSDELDDLFDAAKTLHIDRAADGTEVRLYVAVDPATLHELEQRAAAHGNRRRCRCRRSAARGRTRRLTSRHG